VDGPKNDLILSDIEERTIHVHDHRFRLSGTR